MLKELPIRIHKLRKLQILRLSYCLKIQKLPESIIYLVNLNELDIGGCCRLSELPDDLSGMKNLMQLNMEGCAALTRMPSGIRQWINLQSLRGIDVVDGHGNIMLSELQDLKNLESLHIQHLERRCATLPPLGVLPQLEEVTISGFDLVRVIDDEFYGEDRKPFVFLELRKLTFSEMPRLEMWLGMKSMPRLEKGLGMKSIRRHCLFAKLEELTLIQCPKLMVFLVQFPTSSQLKLKLWLSNEMLMPTSKFNSWSNLGGINMLQIFGCQELRNLPNDIRNIQNL
ncbi:hypothetical protein ZIOFF_010808 [Zingiber officinale]|uniref:Disease resistance R13L4/SHOC-2-like LRR domain-containing protein n=1 Tax=Zingiber officinale TaxID=94328 RepID=A0A8J5HJP9_ZINOF|nr:hypothetical protein ZIOFF_010808 [Zingiber officinale]